MARATSGVSGTATPARFRIAISVMCMNASASVLQRHYQLLRLRVYNEYGEQLGRLRLARVRTHQMAVTGQLRETLTGTVCFQRPIVDLTGNRSVEYSGVD